MSVNYSFDGSQTDAVTFKLRAMQPLKLAEQFIAVRHVKAHPIVPYVKYLLPGINGIDHPAEFYFCSRVPSGKCLEIHLQGAASGAAAVVGGSAGNRRRTGQPGKLLGASSELLWSHRGGRGALQEDSVNGVAETRYGT